MGVSNKSEPCLPSCSPSPHHPHSKNLNVKSTFKRVEEWPLFLHVVFNILSCWIQHLYCCIQLGKMLDTTCRKSGHFSAHLSVDLKFLECTLIYASGVMYH